MMAGTLKNILSNTSLELSWSKRIGFALDAAMLVMPLPSVLYYISCCCAGGCDFCIGWTRRACTVT